MIDEDGYSEESVMLRSDMGGSTVFTTVYSGFDLKDLNYPVSF